MSRRPPVPRLPYLLLGGLTLVSFGGPFAMLVAVRGGSSARWPPDRSVEWVVIGLVCTLALALFCACVSLSWWYPQPRSTRKPTPRDPGSPSRSTFS
jgi:hypothetical protein